MQGSKRGTKNRLLDYVGEGKGGMIEEKSIEIWMLPYVKYMTITSLMYEAGHSRLVLLDNPKGWGGGGVGRGFQDGRTHVHLWLIHVNVWWKPPQYCKVISLQLKEPLDESERRVEKVGLKLNIQKTKNMATGPITSWQIDGETVETVVTLSWGAPKSLKMKIAAIKLKDAYSLEGNLWPT